MDSQLLTAWCVRRPTAACGSGTKNQLCVGLGRGHRGAAFELPRAAGRVASGRGLRLFRLRGRGGGQGPAQQRREIEVASLGTQHRGNSPAQLPQLAHFPELAPVAFASRSATSLANVPTAARSCGGVLCGRGRQTASASASPFRNTATETNACCVAGAPGPSPFRNSCDQRAAAVPRRRRAQL